MFFTVYSRPGCHLCDDMLLALKPWQERYHFDVNVINIDEDEALTKRYAARIPILCVNDREICEYFLDETALPELFKQSIPVNQSDN